MRFNLITVVAAVLIGLAQTAPGQFAFVHPGLLQNRDDLARLKAAVAAHEEPIYSGFQVFRADPHSQATYRLRGPLPMVGRNPTVGQGDYDSDANAAYQCAVMWCITGDRAYANKSKQIIDAWSLTLTNITGRDAVLMAGLGPFKMVNAAELLRSTDAGWSPAEIQQAENNFRTVVYPVIADFAPFANGNWDTAAIKTMMAIGVFCDDRAMFERALRYYVDGSGDGRLTHYIINAAGQCQESGRDQQHTQLGLAHLGDACEIAWHQGLDLYGYDDNLLLKGFEYTAKYNLGENVPFTETLDRTGKYHHFLISTNGRGRFRAVYEEIYNHYVNRAGLTAPYIEQVVQRIRPEGPGLPGADHVGYGTLLFALPHPVKVNRSQPAAPAGLIAKDDAHQVRIAWVASVGAQSYSIQRAGPDGHFETIAKDISTNSYTDSSVTAGIVYRYTVSAANASGVSPDADPVAICAGMPPLWQSRDVGAVALPGRADFDGDTFAIDAAGKLIGGSADQFHFVCTNIDGDGVVIARFVPQPSSQFSQFGLMLRDSVAANAADVALLIRPESTGQIEAPHWTVSLLSRASDGAEAKSVNGEKLSAPAVTFGRMTGPCWLKLERSGNEFRGY
ncbi:MAG TPA: alginate lyase family protein [Verrucomicrobiae bacterium]|nr:alginate lyase family protein [Verrucomicrobiae bacterium]